MGVATGFVLAAGFGTRLRPVSERVPKPLWPLFDRPLATRTLALLAGAGCREVVVNLHHLPEVLRRGLVPNVPSEMRVHWSEENPILGTGGALRPWRDLLGKGLFFLLNGDTYQELDLAELGRFHVAKRAVATLAVRPAAHGPLEIASDGRIVRFLDVRAPGCPGGRPCEFTGVHLLEPAVLGHLPAGPGCINRDVHRHLVGDGVPLYGFIPSNDGFWSDLGTPDRYVSAHLELLRLGRVPPAPGVSWEKDGVTPEGGKVYAPSYLGPGAVMVAGAEVGPFTSVGAGARVERGARLERCVVWHGVRVGPGAWADGFFGPEGTFHPVGGGP